MFSESYLQTSKVFSQPLGTQPPKQGHLTHATLGMPDSRPQELLLNSTINKWSPGYRLHLAPFLGPHQLQGHPLSPGMVLPLQNPNPKTHCGPGFPSKGSSRPRLMSPQSHFANQKGQNAPTHPSSNSAFAECLLYTGYCPAFFTYLILRREPWALLSCFLQMKKGRLAENYQGHTGTLQRVVPPTLQHQNRVSTLLEHFQQIHT